MIVLIMPPKHHEIIETPSHVCILIKQDKAPIMDTTDAAIKQHDL